MKRLLIIAAVSMVQPARAHAQVDAPKPTAGAPAPDRLARNLKVVSKPDADDMYLAMPWTAFDNYKDKGSAVVRCTLNVKGSTENCSLVEVDPVDFGYRSSFLHLARKFKFKALDGAPIEGATVLIPISFRNYSR